VVPGFVYKERNNIRAFFEGFFEGCEENQSEHQSEGARA